MDARVAHNPLHEDACLPSRCQAVSALDGWIDVCRTGTWRDARNREVEITDAMLDGLVAAYGNQDPAPVVVGHPAADAPAYAWVESVRKTGDRLQAKLRDIQAAFREAVEAGSYAGRSVKIVGGALRHVGFLGGRAPAVPGLAPTQFDDGDAGQTICLAEIDLASGGVDAAVLASGDLRFGFHAMARIARGLRERIIASDGIEAADEAIPSWEVDALQRAADEASDNDDATAYSNPQPEEIDVSGNPDKPDEAALAAKEAELAAREERVAESEKTAAQAARLAAAVAALEPHVTAGRLLPAEKAPLAALLASLPDDDTTVSFAAPQGEGEVREKPRAVLDRLFGALPVRVNYTELAGGAAPQAGDPREDNEAIAAEARVLMSEAGDRGEALSATEAVKRVRATRGLGDRSCM